MGHLQYRHYFYQLKRHNQEKNTNPTKNLMQTIKTNIWYAGDKKITSKWKLTVLDDKGRLEITETELKFTGRRNNIAIPKDSITAFSLVRQQVNWGTYLLVNLFLAAYYQIADLSLVALVSILVIGNGIGLLVSYNTSWVKIDYLDAKGQMTSKYFADGDFLGLSGLLGGTKRLLTELSDTNSPASKDTRHQVRK